jgi:hypothetical protein
MGRDGGWYKLFCYSGKQKYFYRKGLTSIPINRSDLPVGGLVERIQRIRLRAGTNVIAPVSKPGHAPI